jgi:hypothetical protein
MPRSSQVPCLAVFLLASFTVIAAEPTEPRAIITIYHPDPAHLWNRVHTALFLRIGPDKKPYGQDRLEPILWTESQHLLTGESATKARAVLDEFARDQGEALIDDPLKRAILQRDLWLIANWAAASNESGAKQLLERLARVINRIALTREQIGKLPDNYTQAASSKEFPASFDPQHPGRGPLPPDLFDPTGPWVCLGREDGPTAPLHLQVHNPFNNSTFFIFLKLPGGREATLAFTKTLAGFQEPLYVTNTDEKTKRSYWHLPNPKLPQWPQGTEVALVRRALLLDSRGNVVASPLTESVQFRVMRIDTPELNVKTVQALEGGLLGDVVNGIAPPTKPSRAVDAQAMFEFQFRRADLFADKPVGLRDVSTERDFKTGFNAHGWDEFDRGLSADEFLERTRPFKNNTASCIGCHRYPGIYGFNSFHGMFPFALQRELRQAGDDNEGYAPVAHKLLPLSIEKIEQAAIHHKTEQATWKALEKLLR